MTRSFRIHNACLHDWPAGVSDGLSLKCALCFRLPAVSWHCTDEAWDRFATEQGLTKDQRLGVVCIDCYATFGGNVAAIQEIQVIGEGMTLVAIRSVAYRWPDHRADALDLDGDTP